MAELEAELQSCCVRGDLARVRELIELENVDINCVTNLEGWTPLHLAATEDNQEAVLYLLQNSADIEKRTSSDSETPLLRALSEGSLQAAEILLRYGADPNAECCGEMTPLLSACYDRHWDIVPLLLEHGADASYHEVNGCTPLHLACSQDAPLNCISTLLDYDANVNAHGERGATPLHFAVLKQTPDLAQLLIDSGASVTLGDCNGLTPLHWAVTSEISQLLLSHNADPRAQNQTTKKTPMHTGVEHNAFGLITSLLELHQSHGEDVSAILLENDGEGCSLMHLARTTEMAKLILEQCPQTAEAVRASYELLVSKTSEGLTVIEMEQQHASMLGIDVTATQQLIRYVESFHNQPLTLPASTIPTPGDAPPRKKQRLAVSIRPNLQGLTTFQRMIAVQFLVMVRDWTVPSTNEAGHVVYEAYMPDDLKYAILGYLSPLDLMKRAKVDV